MSHRSSVADTSRLATPSGAQQESSACPVVPESPHPSTSNAPPTRRTFLHHSTLLLGALLTRAPALHLPRRKRYDVIVRGGQVLDGTGAPGVEGDVAILEGRIAAVGPSLGSDARLVIDARGLAVAPGFIDIHSHADGTMFRDPRVESVIRQGVTTVIIGQDGSSRAPTRAGDPASEEEGSDGASRARGRGRSLAQVFRAIDALPSAVNVASMVGLGTIRHVVVGDDDRPATREEIARMTALVEAALTDGACGASSGLEYTPGAFASREELIALCRPLARRRLPYATHMRNEDDRLLESVEEAIAVARGAGCPLQISHLKTEGERNWGKIDTVLATIERVRREGLDVTFDRYPYVAYQTGLSNLFPRWSKDGGTAAFLERLRDPALAPRLRAAVAEKIALLGGWDNVMISSVDGPNDNGAEGAEGARLGQYAASRGEDPYDVAVRLLVHGRGEVGMVGFAMREENVERFLAHPLAMVCSDGQAVATDGPARTGHPHPRSLGTFPRVLGYYVRERRALTLEDAVAKMTARPAARLRLRDRGRLARGMAADVVVFDPATIRDRATFTNPFQYPEGIRAVLVNGEPALLEGERGDRRTGHTLRPA
jgi:N-acyl-D-amino-acid deacylase